MKETKPAIKSVGVNGGIASILGGTLGLLGVLGTIPTATIAPILAILGGLASIFGRTRATKQIRGIIK